MTCCFELWGVGGFDCGRVIGCVGFWGVWLVVFEVVGEWVCVWWSVRLCGV